MTQCSEVTARTRECAGKGSESSRAGVVQFRDDCAKWTRAEPLLEMLLRGHRRFVALGAIGVIARVVGPEDCRERVYFDCYLDLAAIRRRWLIGRLWPDAPIVSNFVTYLLQEFVASDEVFGGQFTDHGLQPFVKLVRHLLNLKVCL